jgi:Ribbon-helix-helix protein, copG family
MTTNFKTTCVNLDQESRDALAEMSRAMGRVTNSAIVRRALATLRDRMIERGEIRT